jgi:hypothetical protein
VRNLLAESELLADRLERNAAETERDNLITQHALSMLYILRFKGGLNASDG